MSNEAFDRAVKAIAGMHKDMVDPYAVVRTVLEAVREPTSKMIARGDFATNIGAVHVWRDMVDELLKP